MQPLTLKNFGGIQQLVISTQEDLGRIGDLDAARWAATSAPLRDLHTDPAFLAFVDAAGTGRIRVSQLLAARDWLFERLAKRERVEQRSDELLLDDLDSSREAGKLLRRAAEHVIRELKLSDATRLKLADVRAFRAGYAKTLANGDGVVPPALVTDPAVAQYARDVMSVVGSATDASGEAGVGEEHVSRFVADGRAFLEWKALPEKEPQIAPLGPETGAALAAVRAIDKKIEEYFLACDLLRQEDEARAAMRPTPEEWKALKASGPAGIEAYLASSPLAPPSPQGELSVQGKVNPAFETQWIEVSQKVVSRLLPGQGTIDRIAWRKVKSAFDPYLAWLAKKPPEPFETIALQNLDDHVVGPLREKLLGLIAVDKAAAPELQQVIELEKLILYQRWLMELANNLVNFSALYDPEKTALVEMGSFVVDGRRLEFCARVENRGAHKPVAAQSLIFLVYAQVLEKDATAPAFEIVAPVTAGERGRLRPGKRGIFVDTAGKEWDAVVVEIVENPISIREAMLAPFRRMQQFIAKRIQSMTESQLSAREKAMEQQAAQGVDKAAGTAAAAAAAPPAPAPAPAPEKKDSGGGLQGMVLAGSIAFAAVGSALAYVVSAISSITPLRLAASLAGLVCAVAALSAFLGWLKLRARDMGLLFEASGWAINPRMKITRRLGYVFTRTPDFPPGTRVDRSDLLSTTPEAQAHDRRARSVRRWMVFIGMIAAAIAGWYLWRRLR